MAQWWIVGEPWPLTHPTGIAEFPVSGTRAQASMQGAIMDGPFPSKAKADDWIKNAKATNPQGSDLSPGFVSPQQQAGIPGLSIPNPLSGLKAVGDFFQRLTQGNTWIRVAEVIMGAALIIVGLAKLAGDTPLGKAALSIGTKAALL